MGHLGILFLVCGIVGLLAYRISRRADGIHVILDQGVFDLLQRPYEGHAECLSIEAANSSWYAWSSAFASLRISRICSLVSSRSGSDCSRAAWFARLFFWLLDRLMYLLSSSSVISDKTCSSPAADTPIPSSSSSSPLGSPRFASFCRELRQTVMPSTWLSKSLMRLSVVCSVEKSNSSKRLSWDRMESARESHLVVVVVPGVVYVFA